MQGPVTFDPKTKTSGRHSKCYRGTANFSIAVSKAFELDGKSSGLQISVSAVKPELQLLDYSNSILDTMDSENRGHL